MAAVEVLRVLKDNNIETEYPVAAVTWTKWVEDKSFS